MVTGFIANQIATTRTAFPKPTFLPVLLDIEHLASPPVNRKSAITNLNDLTIYAEFGEDLDAMGDMVRFDKLVLLMDEEFSAAIPDLKSDAGALRPGARIVGNAGGRTAKIRYRCHRRRTERSSASSK